MEPRILCWWVTIPHLRLSWRVSQAGRGHILTERGWKCSSQGWLGDNYQDIINCGDGLIMPGNDTISVDTLEIEMCSVLIIRGCPDAQITPRCSDHNHTNIRSRGRALIGQWVLWRASDWPRLSVANAQIYAGVSGHCVRVLSNPGTAVSGSGGRNNDTGWHPLSDSIIQGHQCGEDNVTPTIHILCHQLDHPSPPQ